ncbi:MAG: hypothetical protein N3A02_01780, partial [Rectinema sp.]|nr:hypothetical protein [Rectinema sp.]
AMVPTALASYVRSSESGKQVDASSFSAALKDALLKEGFNLIEFTLSPAYATMDLSKLRPIVPSQAERLVIAAVDIGSISRDGAFYIATVSGSLSVYEIAGGRTLYSASKSSQAPGNSEAEAISNALRTLGSQVFARDLLGALP